jgi:hypothetical protein
MRSSSVINSGRAPGQKGPAALALNVNGKMPAPPEKKLPPPQKEDNTIKTMLEERTWEPDGSESNETPGEIYSKEFNHAQRHFRLAKTCFDN